MSTTKQKTATVQSGN